ncbi:MAG TPA: 1,4-dihydroxy-2-naphthoate polyprenyltransferase [Polyangiaceae bacterium]|nr:1,4-dihydroxy-2-naphthoate polyprenyltransferase [Polyangiaceae bacterium]
MNEKAFTASPLPGLPAPGSLHAWILACRPATLTAAAAPVLVGTAIAAREGQLDILRFVCSLLGAFCLQIGSNFANDVFDYEKGADTAERLGPTRAVQAGLVSPRGMKVGMALVFGIALLAGVYLVSVAGPWLVVIGVASILAAIGYTGGPYPLGYHGLGDAFVFLFFGLVAVAGTVFVQLGTVPPLAWLGALGLGAVTTNILVVNNVRDRLTDVTAGKRTLAVRFGRGFAWGEYVGLYVLAYAVPLVAGWAFGVGPLALLGCATVPLAWANSRDLARLEGRALNPLLGRSAKVVFLYGASLALGLWPWGQA